MASEDQFLVMCPSNGSMKMFPENTTAAFTMQLPQALELGDDWKVGMCEIQYTKSWNNVRKGSNTFIMRYRLPGPDGRLTKPYITRKAVPPGYYTVEGLIKVIRRMIEKHEYGKLKGFRIEYNPMTRRVTVTTKDQVFYDMNNKPTRVRGSVKFRYDLARILGFSSEKLVKNDQTVVGPFAAMPSGGFYNMYVYCDAIRPQIVDNTTVPCLRILPVESKPDETVIAKRFVKPYYMPLAKQRITTIEFKIADESGRNVGFDHGKTVIGLHFRRTRR